MKKILFIILIITSSLFSQINSSQELRIKELKQNAKKSNDNIYIKSQLNKENDLFLFLINESTDTLKITTKSIDNYNINFKKEVLDDSSNWTTKTSYLSYCTVGESFVTMKIPPNHYTWEKIKNSEYYGDYKTKMRISYNINSENILSKEFELSYNSDLFLPKSEQDLKSVNRTLSTNKNLSKKKKIRLLAIKGEAYIDMEKYKKSYVFCDSIENTGLNSDRIKFNKAKSLYYFITKTKITKLEKIAYVSKNITLFKNIDSNNDGINKRVKSYLNILNSFLLLKIDFDNKFSGKHINYYYEIDFIKKEKIKILFKE